MPTKTDRWFFRCIHGCKKSWAVDLERKNFFHSSVQYEYAVSAACPHCGHVPQEAKWCKGLIEHHKIMGKVHRNRLVNIELQTPCDGRCTGAQGPSCDCQCGGANHGSNKLVEVIRDAGAIPKDANQLTLV
jgi:hypothetical protein